ncbi:MAG: hypothetical protein R2843_14915 [Thermomicrobiales bacterium]
MNGDRGITVNPYLGEDSLAPFLSYEGKGVIIVCKTSNPGGGDFQDLKIDDRTLYETVAMRAVSGRSAYRVDRTRRRRDLAEQLAGVRAIAPDLPILAGSRSASGRSRRSHCTRPDSMRARNRSSSHRRGASRTRATALTLPETRMAWHCAADVNELRPL